METSWTSSLKARYLFDEKRSEIIVFNFPCEISRARLFAKRLCSSLETASDVVAIGSNRQQVVFFLNTEGVTFVLY